MANETMRIRFPLKIASYPQGEYGLEDNLTEITSAVPSEDAILATKSFIWCFRIQSLRQKMLAAGDYAERERCCYGK